MNRRKRQFVLFLVALVLPAGLLSALAFRFLRQEEELAGQRAIADYNSAVDGVRRELIARLDGIKVSEKFRRSRESSVSSQPEDSAIVFVTTWNQDGLTPPVDPPLRAHVFSGRLLSILDSGERQEFQSNDLAGASDSYRLALRQSHQPEELCEIRLRLARTLAKSEKMAEARSVYQDMLNSCGAAADDSGVPYKLYAANRLIELKLDVPAVTGYLVREVNSSHLRPMAEAVLIRSLLQPLAGDPAESAKKKIAFQIDVLQQMSNLSAQFAKELASEFGTLRKLNDKWLAYGPEPWLLTAVPATAESEPLYFVVSSTKVAPPGVRLVAQHTEHSAPLGAGFTNLEMEFDPPRVFTGGRAPRIVYAAGLASILGVAVLGGLLLLHGVNRDLQMTEMRSHFVASVSHELRTPLTAIRMFAETLVLGRAGNELSKTEYLETIVSESERLARLVDNVLDFSKIEQGRKIYQSRPTSLPEAVRSAARAMQYPLSQQGFNLDISIDESVPVVMADADAIEQATLNLLSNAMKYSGDARNIELRLKRNGKDALIEVKDGGIGISSEEQQHIFDKFYRVRSSQTDLIAGTGLGLTLVKHTAEAHGGTVDIQSTHGAGSTFTIRIPLSKAVEA